MHVKSTITNIDFSQKLSLQDLSCMSSQQEIRHKFDLDWWKAGRNVVPKPQWQVCNWIRRGVVWEQQDRSKCRPGAAGQVEMSSWSRRTRRNVVPERQDRSKCRPGAGRNVVREQQDRARGRNVVLEQQGRSKCRPGAAGQVEMSSGSSRTGAGRVEKAKLAKARRPTGPGT